MIRHLGKEVMIAEANFVAFFTDIEHEVLPVSKGVRIAFTYNLYTEQKPWPRSITDKLLVGSEWMRNKLLIEKQSFPSCWDLSLVMRDFLAWELH